MIKTYQIYLSTFDTVLNNNNVQPINLSTPNNATWNINFKALFGNDYGKFKRCSLRGHFISTVYNSEPLDANATGYITVSLPSISGSSNVGTVVGLFYPSYAIGTNQAIITFNTLGNVQGVDINMPSENQFLNIQLKQFLETQDNIPLLPNYQILLQFELSEPI